MSHRLPAGEARAGLPEGHELPHLQCVPGNQHCSSSLGACPTLSGNVSTPGGRSGPAAGKSVTHTAPPGLSVHPAWGCLLWGIQRLCEVRRPPLEVLANNSTFNIYKTVSAASCAVPRASEGQVPSELLFFFTFFCQTPGICALAISEMKLKPEDTDVLSCFLSP